MDSEQPVRFVVTVILPRILVHLGQQPANHITLKFGTALRPLCPIAVADFIQPPQMPTQVVAEPAREVVDAVLFDQTIRCIVGKSVRSIVFVYEGSQANRLVVLVTDALALGVLAAGRQSARSTQQTRNLAFAIGFALKRGGLIQGMIVWGRPPSLLRYSVV